MSDLGQLTGLLGVLVAAGAVLASTSATRRALSHERQMRAWERRADTYEELMAWTAMLRGIVTAEIPDDRPDMLDDREVMAMQGKTRLWASTKVSEELTDVWMSIHWLLANAAWTEPSNVSVAKYEDRSDHLHEFQTCVDRIDQTMRDELSWKPRPDLSHRDDPLMRYLERRNAPKH